MDIIFERLSQYGFHDTELSSIHGEKLEIRLNFDKGIYLLNETGKENVLSNPTQILFKISSYYSSFEEALEIKEYGKKIKYLDYSSIKKYIQEDGFGISMVYYSKFNNCVLFDGGVSKKNIMFSIEGISEIIIRNFEKGN